MSILLKQATWLSLLAAIQVYSFLKHLIKEFVRESNEFQVFCELNMLTLLKFVPTHG